MAEHSQHDRPSGGGYGRWVFWGFMLIGAYFLLTEHRAHTFQYLPFLLLLACAVMHFFHGHGGHGRHGSKEEHGQQSPESKTPEPEKKHGGGCH